MFCFVYSVSRQSLTHACNVAQVLSKTRKNVGCLFELMNPFLGGGGGGGGGFRGKENLIHSVWN